MSGNTSRGEKSLKGTLLFIAVGLLVTALLGVAKVIFERSSFGHSAETFAFELLQGQLPYFDSKNPVVVLDTTDIPRDSKGVGNLEEIIPALVAQGPLAIGVDWDFSPKESEFASPEDPKFFNTCLDEMRKHKVPIFLGVGARKAAPPAAWLGDPQYKELAAGVGASEMDVTRLPIWSQKRGVSEPLPLLGYALAKAYSEKRGGELPRPPRWIAWAVSEGREDSPEYDFIHEDRLVNYSNLEAMRLAAQRDQSVQSVTESGAKSYQGKIVILGDSSEGFSDGFSVPGVRGKRGGVLLHASAAYTFAQAPLFELKPWVRAVIDFVIAAIIVVVVAVMRYRHAGERDFSLRRHQIRFVWGVMALVVVAGWLLLLYTRVMWLDFILVLGALFLHPKLEGRIDDLHERRSRPTRRRRTRGGGGRAATRHAQPPATQAAAAQAAGAQPAGTPPASTQGTKVAAGLLAGLLALAPAARAQGANGDQCREGAAAVVVAVKKSGKKKSGTCYFREIGVSDWTKITDADNERRLLQAGQQLFCDQGCVLVIRFCSTQNEYEVKNVMPAAGGGRAADDKKQADWWYTVLEAYRFVPQNDPHPNPAARRQPPLAFVPVNPNPQGDASAYALTPHGAYGADYAGLATDSVSTTALIGVQRGERVGSVDNGERARASTSEMGTERSAKSNSERASIPSRKTSEKKTKGAAIPARGTSSASDEATSSRESVAEARRAEIETSAAALEQRYYEVMKAQPEAQERYAAALRSANAARDAKDYAAAAQLYSQAQQILPEEARAYHGLGNVYADQRRWDEAMKSYRQAVVLAPLSAPAWLAFGYSLIRSAQGPKKAHTLAQAEHALVSTLVLDPRNATAYDLLDSALEQRGATAAEAEAVYGRLIAFSPDSVEAYLRLSYLLRRAGKYHQAGEQLKRAALRAKHAPELRSVADAYEMQGHYEEAESALSRVLAFEPNDAGALFALGRVLLLRRHYDEAALQLARAAELSPKEFAPSFLLGLNYLDAGRLPEAERAFGVAATLAGADRRALATAAFNLGRVGDAYARARRLPDAVRVYEQALQLDPGDGENKQKLEAARAKMTARQKHQGGVQNASAPPR